MHKTSDLVHWTYVGDVFSVRPNWVAPTAGLWAPAIKFSTAKYSLYYAASDTKPSGAGRRHWGGYQRKPDGSLDRQWHARSHAGGRALLSGYAGAAVIDPEMIQANGRNYIYFG